MDIELLAPARDLECGIAAVDHGADAVYIGAEHYGARAAAGNTTADIGRLCEYAHRYGVRVYVTLNTLIHDDEADDVRRLIDELCAVKVDAVLVQDMRVAEMVRQARVTGRRPLSLHASTQTDNRTIEDVRRLRDMAFDRVVLARELTLDEITAIGREVPDIELEVFVHGALCVSYSGRCHASEYCFNRSADRGECAQFCRMKFDLVDSRGTVIEKGRHLLSLKDMNRLEHIEDLLDAGVMSLKIEGRLKDICYVKNVTAAYSERLNEIIARRGGEYRRASLGRCKYTFKPDVRKSFNRGFTDYFLHGRTPGMASPDTPKAMGECVGRVKEMSRTTITMAGTSAFANGDGLCFVNDERELTGFRVNRAENNVLFPLKMPRGLHRGMLVYRNSDHDFERLLMRKSAGRKIAVTLTLGETTDGYGLEMNITERDMVFYADIKAEKHDALTPQRENIIRQLTRLGNTVFECRDIRIDDDCDRRFIPSSLLTELRRNVCRKAETGIDGIMSGVCADGRRTDDTAITGHVSRDPQNLLMQCRYCLRYALGCCTRHGGREPRWREPLTLVLGDRRRFTLRFDCKNCQMNVSAE